MRSKMLLGVAAVAAIAPISHAQLMVPDSGAGDRVMLFSDFDGSVIDLNWITDVGAPFAFTTPKEARVIGNQIWVSDQVADAVHRFDLSRNFLGSITAHPSGGVIDNLRGFGSDGNRVFLTLFHATTARRGVAIYDLNGNPTGFFPGQTTTASLFDAAVFQGDLLISSSTSNNIERWSTAGVFQGSFATGVTFPQQCDVLSDGTVIAVSTIAPQGVEGVYRFNPNGSLHTYIDTQGIKNAFGETVPRAAWPLGDGGYMIATDKGVFKAVGSGSSWTFSQIVAGVDAQYINPVPTPGAMGLMMLGAAAVLRRRR
ncbi:MAG: hypothetical protein ACKVZJ_15130 [Phycisphaerales bacterium]